MPTFQAKQPDLESNFTCPVCGARKYFPPSELPWRKTCGAACYPKWKKGTRTGSSFITCIQCGRAKLVRNSVIRDRNPKFCSTSCMGAYRRDHGTMSRENHPRWKGGDDWEQLIHRIRTSTPYLRWVEAVRVAADGCCQGCGETGGEAHHLVKIELLLRAMLDPTLGRYLCDGCHVQVHAAREAR